MRAATGWRRSRSATPPGTPLLLADRRHAPARGRRAGRRTSAIAACHRSRRRSCGAEGARRTARRRGRGVGEDAREVAVRLAGELSEAHRLRMYALAVADLEGVSVEAGELVHGRRRRALTAPRAAGAPNAGGRDR